MIRVIFSLLLWLLLVLPSGATAKFGVCSTSCTWDSSSTAMWSLSSGGATGAAVPNASDTVTFDAATCVGGTTCTITLNFGGPITIQSLTLGACTASTTGCVFDNSVNNNNMTLTASGVAFNGSGTGTRTYKLGTATYTISNNAGTVSFATSTNLTNTGNTGATWSFTGTGVQTFASAASLSHGNLSIGARSNTGTFTVGSGNAVTFNALSVTGPNRLIFAPFITTTITNPLSIAGSSGNAILFESSTQTVTATVAVAGGSGISWAGFSDMTFTGSPIATNSFNLGNNSGITITPPSGGGAQCVGC